MIAKLIINVHPVVLKAKYQNRIYCLCLGLAFKPYNGFYFIEVDFGWATAFRSF